MPMEIDRQDRRKPDSATNLPISFVLPDWMLKLEVNLAVVCWTQKSLQRNFFRDFRRKDMSKAPAAAAAPAAAPVGGAAQPQGTQELTAFVQNLLQQMQVRFQEMSDAIITRIDEMGARIDDLEKSIAELMQQAGVEEGDSAAAQPKN
jgi:heat shock factor-binding protein 1